MNFVSFTPDEVKSIVLKRYNKSNSFSTALDSSAFFNEQDYRMKQSGDTLSFTSSLGALSLNPNFDYTVSLPAANRSVRISEIDNEQVTGDCSGKVQCVNPVCSLKTDGVRQSLKEVSYNFYITK